MCILLLINNIALPLSLFSDDAKLDVHIGTWQSKVFTMHVYVHFNMVEFWHVKLDTVYPRSTKVWLLKTSAHRSPKASW